MSRSATSAAGLRFKPMGIRSALIISALAVALARLAQGQEPAPVPAVVDRYCTKCHDAESAKGDLDLASAMKDGVGRHPEVWEKVVRRLNGRQMPPAGKPRPSEEVYSSVLSQLEATL